MPSASDNPRLYLGAYAICRDSYGRMLLVRMRSGLDQGQWTMPGGGVEWGEHPDATLLRELEEEAGIVDVEMVRLATLYSHTYMRSEARPYDSVHHVGIVYDVTVRRPELQVEQDGSTDCCRWFTEDEARQLLLTPAGKFAVDLAWPSR